MVHTVSDKMDFSNILADAMKKQRELLKSREHDGNLHCKRCSRIIKDDEGYLLKKVGFMKHEVICIDCENK